VVAQWTPLFSYDVVIRPDSEAGKALSKTELTKRTKGEQEKKLKLQNPNFFISKTRISVRSLPVDVDDRQYVFSSSLFCSFFSGCFSHSWFEIG